MLVVVRVDLGCNCDTERVGFSIGRHVNLQDAGEANLEFDMAILVKVIIPNILCQSEKS